MCGPGHHDQYISLNMWSLGQIEHCMDELQQLLFPWRDIEICDVAKDTPFNENSRSSYWNASVSLNVKEKPHAY